MRYILALAFFAILIPGIAIGRESTVSCHVPEGVPETHLLLLGELHGSKEAPALAGKIACARAVTGPVGLGLEIPLSEQIAIDSYLSSDGGKDAKQKLLAGEFWQTDDDGRASTAMFDLIEYIRQLKHRGMPVSIFAFAKSGIRRHTTRDAALARSIRNLHAEHSALRMVVLVGNVHASQAPVLQLGKESLVPAGYLLRDLHPVSVFLGYPAGTVWVCMPDCGIHQTGEVGVTQKPELFYRESPMPGYSMSFMLPSITASRPAISQPPR